MEDKFAKRTNCLYCGKEMESEYRSKKFCTDKCRVYFNRETPKIKIQDLTTPTNVVKPITELPKTTNKVISTMPDPKNKAAYFKWLRDNP